MAVRPRGGGSVGGGVGIGTDPSLTLLGGDQSTLGVVDPSLFVGGIFGSGSVGGPSVPASPTGGGGARAGGGGEMVGSVQAGLVQPRPTGGGASSGGGVGSVQAGLVPTRPRGGDPLGGDGTQPAAPAPNPSLFYPNIPGGAPVGPPLPRGRRNRVNPPAPVRMTSLLGF